MKKICFIVNSQKKGLDRLKTQIKREFTSNFELGFLFTTCYRDAELLAQTAVQLGYSYIVAVGGDGTVNEVINGLMVLPEEVRNKIIVGVIPWGTGNDFVRTIGASDRVQNLYNQILEHRVSKIDAVEMSFKKSGGDVATRYFINVSDIGIGANTLITVRNIAQWIGGKKAFYLAAVKALFLIKSKVVKIVTPEQVFEGRVKCVCIANGRYFGSGLGIAPLAKVDDGLLDLVVIENVSAFDFIRLASKLRKSEVIKHPKVHYLRTKECEIFNNSSSMPLEVDGEVVGEAPLSARILPASIYFLGNIFASQHKEGDEVIKSIERSKTSI